MPAGRTQLGRDELSRGLAKLRDDAGLSGAEAARHAGVGFSQSKISRWESGRLLPSPDDVERYASVLGASSAVILRLVAKAHDLHDQHRISTPSRITLRRTADYQERVGRIEAESSHLATFHPLLIPGLLQTPPYIRSIFSSGNLSPAAVDATVKAGVERRQLLQDESRQFTFVIPSGAVAWRAGSTVDMAQQIEHLSNVIGRPNIKLGVIPWGTQATVFPTDGFNIYDEKLVIVGVGSGAAHITSPRDIAPYIRRLGDLEKMAVYDDEAREVLAAIAADYQELS